MSDDTTEMIQVGIGCCGSTASGLWAAIPVASEVEGARRLRVLGSTQGPTRVEVLKPPPLESLWGVDLTLIRRALIDLFDIMVVGVIA